MNFYTEQHLDLVKHFSACITLSMCVISFIRDQAQEPHKNNTTFEISTTVASFYNQDSVFIFLSFFLIKSCGGHWDHFAIRLGLKNIRDLPILTIKIAN